jgi:hypothetical protein
MKTAVEWYDLRSRKLIHKYIEKEICVIEFLQLHNDLFYNVAKMEKKQIIYAFEIGSDCTYDLNLPTSAEQYYEQTYGGNK